MIRLLACAGFDFKRKLYLILREFKSKLKVEQIKYDERLQ